MSILYCIDFDDTLNRSYNHDEDGYNPIYDVVNFCLNRKCVILTARRYTPSNMKYIKNFLSKVSLDIVDADIHFTDKGDKGPVMTSLMDRYGAKKAILIDDNEMQRRSVVKENLRINKTPDFDPLEAYHPSDISLIDNRVEKIAKLFSLATKRKAPSFFKQNRDYINNSDDNKSKDEFKSNFKNELGNDISLKIKRDKKTKDKIKYYYLKIIMEGPSSIMENEITEVEAKEIKKILNKLFWGKNEHINKKIS